MTLNNQHIYHACHLLRICHHIRLVRRSLFSTSSKESSFFVRDDTDCRWRQEGRCSDLTVRRKPGVSHGIPATSRHRRCLTPEQRQQSLQNVNNTRTSTVQCVEDDQTSFPNSQTRLNSHRSACAAATHTTSSASSSFAGFCIHRARQHLISETR
jgi:hypothetical protein